MTDEDLLERATAVAAFAYAPYSELPVGAAVLLSDGRVVTGANVENASFTVGVCAERAALARAIAEGAKPGDIEAVATTSTPCGACRQWFVELGVERVVYRDDGDVLSRTPAELLPGAFRL
jgi:cytidine deaminase